MVLFNTRNRGYVVEDMAPLVYAWINEPADGISDDWKYAYLCIALIVFGITLFGYASTAL